MTYLDIAKQLISFESDAAHPEKISECVSYIDSLFPKDTFHTEIIEHDGVLSIAVSFNGADWKDAVLLINGHIDVVGGSPAQFTPIVCDGKLFGRGSVDMKGSAAAAIAAFLKVAEEGGNFPSAALLLTGDEEVGGTRGAGYICAHFDFHPAFVLVIDGPRVDQLEITNREKGMVWVELTARGTSAHASRPWLGDNAIDKIYAAIDSIRREFHITNTAGWQTTLSVTSISTTNKTNNKIPEEAKAMLDIRFVELDAISVDDLLQRVQSVIGTDVSARCMVGGAPVFVSADHPDILVLQNIMNKRNTLQQHVPITYSDAAHDARYFFGKGLTTALIGPVGGNWHGEDEWVSIDSLDVVYTTIVEYIKYIGRKGI